MNKIKLTVLDDKAINELLDDRAFIERFPQILEVIEEAKIKAQSVIRPGCKLCEANSKIKSIGNMMVKIAIAKFSETDKEKLKDFLETEKIQIIFKSHGDKLVNMIF